MAARTVSRGNYSVRVYDNAREQGRQAEQIKAEEAAAAAAQAEMDRIAAERRAIAEQQQQQLAAAQAQALKIQEEQAAQAEQLQAAYQLRISQIQSFGNAVSQSLRALGAYSAGGKQGPTASMTRRKPGRTGASSTAASLRIGTMGRSPGSGANLAT